MIKLVMDTSSLISLELIGALEKSIKIVEIMIPKAVKEEIMEIAKYKDKEGNSAKNIIKLIRKENIKICEIKNKKNVGNLLSKNVGRGEAECFACCLENKILKLIMDDINAAYSLEGLAMTHKIDIKISIAILVELYYQKIIDKRKLQGFVKRLIKTREWEGGALEVLSKRYLDNL